MIHVRPIHMERPGLAFAWRAIGSTWLLGLSVGLGWFLVGIFDEVAGVAVPSLAHDQLIYPQLVTAGLAMSILALLVRGWWRLVPLREAMVLIGVAWLGEWLVMVSFGWVLADEIAGGLPATWAWAVATGWGLQPLAAIIGAVAGDQVRARGVRERGTRA